MDSAIEQASAREAEDASRRGRLAAIMLVELGWEWSGEKWVEPDTVRGIIADELHREPQSIYRRIRRG